MTVPWDDEYTNPAADPALQTQVGLGGSGPVVPEATPTSADEASGPVVTGPPPVALPPTPAPVPAPAPAPVGGIPAGASLDDIEDVVKAAAAIAAKEALEQAKAAVPGVDTVQSIDPKDLLRASARSRAVRTLVHGILITAFWAVITAVGTLSDVDWFSREGWSTVAAVAGAAAASSVVSYIARIVSPPPLAAVAGGG